MLQRRTDLKKKDILNYLKYILKLDILNFILNYLKFSTNLFIFTFSNSLHQQILLHPLKNEK